MKKLVFISLFCISSSAMALDQGDVLSGDTKMACEAVLCLSSSTRPGECSPSLDRYFGIKKKKFSDTINARINFLNLCPASNEPNMPTLISAIANGAGRCDSEYLNRFNREIYYRQVCTETGYSFNKETTCSSERISVVSDEKPYYCTAYEHHEFTDLNTRYVGDKFNGGKWYDGKDYEKALAELKKVTKLDEQEQNGNSRFKNRTKPSVTYTSERDYLREQRQSR